jgi:hypothetical protein
VSLLLIESSIVSVDKVILKFARSVSVSSIKDECFIVATNEATPVEIVSPFRKINYLTDYNQVSRVLNLYWDNILPANTEYKLTATGLRGSAGQLLPDDFVVFVTGIESATPSELLKPGGTIIDSVLISDKSVRIDIETGYQILAKNPDFYITDTIPHSGDFYISNSENRGRLVIKFNQRPAANFLSSKFFRAQRKKIQRTPSRWENVSARISMHSWRPEVYVDFPSLDLEEVYYEYDRDYYETGYKYRVIVSSQIGI